MNSVLKSIRIVRVEERPNDAWLDMSLRQLREGKARIYHVNDPLTGKWLFKVCLDIEMKRTIVKALKCPPGRLFAQLEGSTMLFQECPLREGYYYDVISISYPDKSGRLRRNIVEELAEIPVHLRDNFEVLFYEDVTGKKAPGKKLVVVCKENDEKAMILLFLLQRAWPISEINPDQMIYISKILNLIKNLERASIEDLYREAKEKFNLRKEIVDMILTFLEKENKIERPEEDYVKIK
ncbi:TPA: hypothetical protein EYP70_00615 [Candidatus Bathyarchaeota archaeon]|nr:hypothetical protein [Candidatus Bathyarchaeota archaeon]